MRWASPPRPPAASPSSMTAASSTRARRAACSTRAPSRGCASSCRPITTGMPFEGKGAAAHGAPSQAPPSTLRRPLVEDRKAALVPDRIGGLDVARGVELRDLPGRQLPADGADVLAQLLFVARANDETGHGRTAQQPVERDLRRRLAGLLGDAIERVDDIEQAILFVARSGFRNRMGACAGLRRLSAPDFSSELAPAERAPDDRADALVAAELHELPFVIAVEQRIIGLVRNIPGIAVTVRRGE